MPCPVTRAWARQGPWDEAGSCSGGWERAPLPGCVRQWADHSGEWVDFVIIPGKSQPRRSGVCPRARVSGQVSALAPWQQAWLQGPCSGKQEEDAVWQVQGCPARSPLWAEVLPTARHGGLRPALVTLLADAGDKSLCVSPVTQAGQVCRAATASVTSSGLDSPSSALCCLWHLSWGHQSGALPSKSPANTWHVSALSPDAPSQPVNCVQHSPGKPGFLRPRCYRPERSP